jgi:hypothetical protein
MGTAIPPPLVLRGRVGVGALLLYFLLLYVLAQRGEG